MVESEAHASPQDPDRDRRMKLVDDGPVRLRERDRVPLANRRAVSDELLREDSNLYEVHQFFSVAGQVAKCDT
jgi:hypothetical protein